MGDTHPLTNNEHFVLMDVAENATEEESGERRKEGFLLNGRFILITISIVSFLLSLALFIGTVVVYYNHPNSDGCPLLPPPTLSENRRWQWSPSPDTGNQGLIPSGPKPNPAIHIPIKEVGLSVTKVNGKNVRPGVLIYGEEFDEFDTKKWDHLDHDPVSFIEVRAVYRAKAKAGPAFRFWTKPCLGPIVPYLFF